MVVHIQLELCDKCKLIETNYTRVSHEKSWAPMKEDPLQLSNLHTRICPMTFHATWQNVPRAKLTTKNKMAVALQASCTFATQPHNLRLTLRLHLPVLVLSSRVACDNH